VWKHPRGDHITYLMVFSAWEDKGFSDDWSVCHLFSKRACQPGPHLLLQLPLPMRVSARAITRGQPVKLFSRKSSWLTSLLHHRLFLQGQVKLSTMNSN
jgi:hypothetical protein